MARDQSGFGGHRGPPGVSHGLPTVGPAWTHVLGQLLAHRWTQRRGRQSTPPPALGSGKGVNGQHARNGPARHGTGGRSRCSRPPVPAASPHQGLGATATPSTRTFGSPMANGHGLTPRHGGCVPAASIARQCSPVDCASVSSMLGFSGSNPTAVRIWCVWLGGTRRERVCVGGHRTPQGRGVSHSITVRECRGPRRKAAPSGHKQTRPTCGRLHLPVWVGGSLPRSCASTIDRARRHGSICAWMQGLSRV